MYTSSALLDLHERGHRSLRRLIEHCGALGAAKLDRKVRGFGYPTVRLQVHHVIAAQGYWLSVLQGRFDGGVEDDDAAYPTLASLETYRRRVARRVRAWLAAASAKELNTPRKMLTWPDKLRVLVPARVFVRTLTHIYHHQGQVLAMCRLLGKPGPPGLDFPIL